MLPAAVVLILVVFLFSLNNGERIDTDAYIAIAFICCYLFIYLWLPPQPEYTSIKMGQLYVVVPLVSFGAILFPHFNTKSPETVTKVIGWFGLILVAIVLCIFKIFVW